MLSTEVAVLAVVVLHRPLGDAYSLFGTTSPGKFFGVRLSYDDKLFVQHGTEKMVRHEIDRPYTGQPMVIGFALQPSRARGTLFVHDSDPHRYTYHYDTSQEFMPPAGALQIGGSEFDGELGAVMEVLDIGVWNGSVTESAVVYDAMTLAAQYGLTRPRELSEEGLSEV